MVSTRLAQPGESAGHLEQSQMAASINIPERPSTGRRLRFVRKFDLPTNPGAIGGAQDQ